MYKGCISFLAFALSFSLNAYAHEYRDSTEHTATIPARSDSTGHVATTPARSDSTGHVVTTPARSDSTGHTATTPARSDSTKNAVTTPAGSDSAKNTATTPARSDSTEHTASLITWRYGVDSTACKYGQMLTDLIMMRQARIMSQLPDKRPNAYGLRMVLPPTFYSSSILQQFSTSRKPVLTDVHLESMYMVNDAFASMYVNRPELVVQTDSELKQAGTLRKDVQQPLTSGTKLSDKVITVNLDSEMNENVELVTRKPNFWSFPGSGELKFTQYYYSENWHKGGDNTYSMLAILRQRANYDNRRKIKWENYLEMELGFQTISDKYRSLKPTNNLLRLTTKFGYKAFKTVYYTTEVRASTQLVSAYDDNTKNLRTAILSPMDLRVSVGMEYNFRSKGGAFWGKLYVAPCAYDMRYVKHDNLVGRYGIKAGKHSYHKFGPYATLEHNWNIYKNISWTGKLYWVSNFEYTNIEWENRFRFTINKFLNAELWMKPKFDDSSKSYKGDHGYLMMHEWFALGFNYNW